MQIAEHSWVVMEYVITNNIGVVVDQSDPAEPMGFVYGTGEMPNGLERRLLGKSAGDQLEFRLPPEDAYGVHQESLVREIQRDSIPPEVELRPGKNYRVESSLGLLTFKLLEMTGDTIIGDFNHPLAGKHLNFQVKILQVRPATAIEITMALNKAQDAF